jgi:hypothetical protein
LTLRVHDTIKANARDGFRDMDGSDVGIRNHFRTGFYDL